MFESVLAELEFINNRVEAAHDQERRLHSASHKACRAQQEFESFCCRSLMGHFRAPVQMLKNGATPGVVDFAQVTTTTFSMFELLWLSSSFGNSRVKAAHDQERLHSASHNA